MIHARGSSWPFVKSSVVLTVIPRFRRRARDVESKLRQRKIISFYAQSFNRYAWRVICEWKETTQTQKVSKKSLLQAVLSLALPL